MLQQHDLEFRVRYQETDAMGRVHHANYLTWFELGRTELLRAAGFTYREVEERGYLLVISEVSCRYFLPARYDDLLRLRTITTRAKGASIEHEYELYRDDQLLAKGRTVVACVDHQGNIKRLPEWLRVKERSADSGS